MTATGKTDQNGMAMLSIPTSGPGDPPGVAPGFYRVEITKDGEKIPAKYNTETIFGQEVALDAEGNSGRDQVRLGLLRGLAEVYGRMTVVPLSRRIKRRISSTLMVESTCETGRPVSETIWSIGVASPWIAARTCCSNSFKSSSAG